MFACIESENATFVVLFIHALLQCIENMYETPCMSFGERNTVESR